MPKETNQFAIPRTALAGLLTHAASAARILGNLGDATSIGPLADHVDAIVYGPSELLGAPGTHAVPDAIASEDRIVCDGARMLTSEMAGAR